MVSHVHGVSQSTRQKHLELNVAQKRGSQRECALSQEVCLPIAYCLLQYRLIWIWIQVQRGSCKQIKFETHIQMDLFFLLWFRSVFSVHVYTQTQIRTHKHKHTQTRTHTHKHTLHTRTHTQTHAHTHTQILAGSTAASCNCPRRACSACPSLPKHSACPILPLWHFRLWSAMHDGWYTPSQTKQETGTLNTWFCSVTENSFLLDVGSRIWRLLFSQGVSTKKPVGVVNLAVKFVTTEKRTIRRRTTYFE